MGYPVERYFGVEPGERDLNSIATLESRVLQLEVAYGLKFGQSANELSSTAVTIPHGTSVLAGPAVTVEIGSREDVVLIYFEVTASHAGAGNGIFGVHVRDSVSGIDSYMGNRSFAAGTKILSPSPVSNAFGIAGQLSDTPRGSQLTIANYTPGTHTLQMLWKWTDSAGATSGTVDELSFSVDVL